MQLEIKQSEDGLWRYRWREDESWSGGYKTEDAAREAAYANQYRG